MTRPRLLPLLAAVVMSTASAGVAYVSFDFPAKYLGSELVIGINGTLPGWSHPSGQTMTKGFDIDLAKFIAAEVGADHVRYEPLKPGERVTALLEKRVDLVISNFSIEGKAWPDTSKGRRELIDFAGPYYKDNSGIMYSEQKLAALPEVRSGIPVARVCASNGTTAVDYLDGGGVKLDQPECFKRFADPTDLGVVGVVTDQSILTAYTLDQKTTVAPAEWEDEQFPIKDNEFYGVGMRKDVPGLCVRLNAAINKFLSGPWDTAFEANLKEIKQRDSHKPRSIDSTLCD
ncbi:transporter substrate-binding domain-containing protein [Lentzea sp. NPDC092896]|uniref:transporter substrate-binding domain-containing protein n=1 Tax=Lentzea sp. NPDC092896 TaxID=3364127 RepID=UPI0037F25C1A